MKLLALHSDFIEIEVKQKAIQQAEEVKEARQKFEECLVIFTSVEARDEANPSAVVENFVNNVKDISEKVKTNNIVIYPYVHLSSNPAKPSIALEILKKAEEKLKQQGFNVGRAAFGWYKAFTIKVKGHPLAELSREFSSEKSAEKSAEESSEKQEEVPEALKKEEKLKSYWYILTPDGELVDADKFDYSGYENLRKFVNYEVSKVRTYSKEPIHIQLMKKLELVGYENASDSGFFKWYPKGTIIKRLLEKHVTNVVKDYGAMEVETPIMYDYNHPALFSYLNRFPARQYVIESEKRKFFLRFAACFGQYLMMNHATISYKNLPLKLFELTHYSFRKEQSGELAGLKRLRCFTMPDMHTLVKDIKEAKEEFIRQYKLCIQYMKDLELDYEVGIRFVRDFFEENKAFAIELVKLVNKPVLIEIWDEKPFYFVMKFEFNFIDNNDKASALSTVQIDVENAKRFDIKYKDRDNKDRTPLLLHASISGSIDRCVYALLEKAYKDLQEGKPPMLPLWLSPIQLRLLPVSNEKHLEYCKKLAKELEANIRVDIDDYDETISKKIRRAETEWIPYIAVIGDQEIKEGLLTIRIRKSRKQERISKEELIERIKKETNGKPFVKLGYTLLSKRPIFA